MVRLATLQLITGNIYSASVTHSSKMVECNIVAFLNYFPHSINPCNNTAQHNFVLEFHIIMLKEYAIKTTHLQ